MDPAAIQGNEPMSDNSARPAKGIRTAPVSWTPTKLSAKPWSRIDSGRTEVMMELVAAV